MFETLSHLAAGALGGILALFFSHLLSKSRDRTSQLWREIKGDQMEMIPLLDSYISEASKPCSTQDHDGYVGPDVVFFNCIKDLQAWHLRFRLHLKGSQLNRLNSEWDKMESIKWEDLQGKNAPIKKSAFPYSDKLNWKNIPVEYDKIQKKVLPLLKSYRELVKNAHP